MYRHLSVTVFRSQVLFCFYWLSLLLTSLQEYLENATWFEKEVREQLNIILTSNIFNRQLVSWIQSTIRMQERYSFLIIIQYKQVH